MVVIRLSRAGAKKRPFYHLVVTDRRARRDSNYIEAIGYFNPIATGQEIRLHMDLNKITYWQGVGAQLSDRVKSLIKEFKKTQPQVAAADAAKKVSKKKSLTTEATSSELSDAEVKDAKTKAEKSTSSKVAPKKTTAKSTAKKTVKKPAKKAAEKK